MKTIILSLLVLLNVSLLPWNSGDENIRYVLIEAKCKPGFDALPDYKDKIILTKVFKREFENPYEVVNAEPTLISEFEVALEKAYPNSINQVKDVLVYMLNTEKEAKELYDRKLKHCETMDIGIIDLKIK